MSDPWVGLPLLLLAGVAIHTGVLTVFTALRLTHPPRRSTGWAVARGLPTDPSELIPPLPFESAQFVRAGRTMPVWRVRGGDPAGPLVVLVHGWGGSRVEGLRRLAEIAPSCRELLAWDLPGQGEAGGVCTLGAYERRDLCSLVEDAGEPAVLFGWSLGAEICLRAAPALAGRGLLAGLLLEAPFRRGYEPAKGVLEGAGYPRLLNLPPALAAVGIAVGEGPGFRWRDVLSEIGSGWPGVPTLVLHGDADSVSPPGDGRSIAADLGGRFVGLPGGGHDDLWKREETAAACAREAAVFLVELSRDRATRPA